MYKKKAIYLQLCFVVEKYETALEIYNTLLTENASNIMVMKRRVWLIIW